MLCVLLIIILLLIKIILLGFIYLVRDPRDVILSYSNHLNKSIENTFNKLKILVHLN